MVSPTVTSQESAAWGLGSAIILDQIVDARAPWSAVVARGDLFTIVDLHGNQAVDCVMYNAHATCERYSAPDTIAAQANLFLRVGTTLRSNEGAAMMVITDTAVAYHDTIGGACSKESNSLRYGHHTTAQHACVENFVHEHAMYEMGKRDIQSNINWFMNVPVEPDGTLGIVDGISSAGLHVTLRAEMDVLVIVSNCPQINNPCNGFNPTSVRMIVSRG